MGFVWEWNNGWRRAWITGYKWGKLSVFTYPCPGGCFLYLFLIHTTLALVATSWEGRKEGWHNQLSFIYSNCRLCSSPTETMCLWKPFPAMGGAGKVLQFLCAVTPSCRRWRNGVKCSITATKNRPQPRSEHSLSSWSLQGRKRGRIPWQVDLGRAAGSQLLAMFLVVLWKPQNVSGSCRHRYHEIFMRSWRAQSWLMVRNSPYDKSEAKYNWEKEDGGVAITGRQK